MSSVPRQRIIKKGEEVFWDVHDPEKTVVIRLKDEKYSRLVVKVDDPPATVADIQGYVGTSYKERH